MPPFLIESRLARLIESRLARRTRVCLAARCFTGEKNKIAGVFFLLQVALRAASGLAWSGQSMGFAFFLYFLLGDSVRVCRSLQVRTGVDARGGAPACEARIGTTLNWDDAPCSFLLFSMVLVFAL